MTACKPDALLPSLMTAKDIFFWRRTDFTQPFTWTEDVALVGADNNWRMVGGKIDVEAKRRNMLGAKAIFATRSRKFIAVR